MALGDEPVTEIIEGIVLPENVERGAKGSAGGFNTSIFTGANGAEFRSVNWSRSIGRWSISLGYREDTDADFLAVMNAFYACRGRAYGLIWKDWADYRLVAQPLAPANTDGAMQIQKIYTAGTASYARKITRPKPATTIIYDASGTVIPGATVDYSTGLVTGASVGATCTCEFLVAVRFDSDSLEIDVERDGLVNVPSIDLVELQE